MCSKNSTLTNHLRLWQISCWGFYSGSTCVAFKSGLKKSIPNKLIFVSSNLWAHVLGFKNIRQKLEKRNWTPGQSFDFNKLDSFVAEKWLGLIASIYFVPGVDCIKVASSQSISEFNLIFILSKLPNALKNINTRLAGVYFEILEKKKEEQSIFFTNRCKVSTETMINGNWSC